MTEYAKTVEAAADHYRNRIARKWQPSYHDDGHKRWGEVLTRCTVHDGDIVMQVFAEEVGHRQNLLTEIKLTG